MSKELKPDRATRTLELPGSINQEFDSIKNFGNFKHLFAHKYFHSFYSMGIAMAMRDDIILSKIHDVGINFDFNPKKEKKTNSIDAERLARHDLLFKTIAYWILMKQEDSECYKVLVRTNLAREICEEIFLRFWPIYSQKILANLSSKIPNIRILNDSGILETK